jgi:hypothetical protein
MEPLANPFLPEAMLITHNPRFSSCIICLRYHLVVRHEYQSTLNIIFRLYNKFGLDITHYVTDKSWLVTLESKGDTGSIYATQGRRGVQLRLTKLFGGKN